MFFNCKYFLINFLTKNLYNLYNNIERKEIVVNLIYGNLFQ